MSLQGAIRAGRAFIEIFADDGALERGLKATRTKLAHWAKSLAIAGGVFTGAAGAIAAPLIAATKYFAEAGDELVAVSEITGVAVESLSALRYAAEQADVPIESLQGSLVKMNNTIGEAKMGTASARLAISQLGLSLEELKDLKPEKQFELIAEKISRIKDPAQRTKAAIDIFGRGAAELMPLISKGAAGIQMMRTEAAHLGATMSGFDAAKGKLFVELWRQLMAAIGGVRGVVGSTLLPEVNRGLKKIIEMVVRVREWIDANRGLVWAVVAVVAALVTFGGTLLGMGIAAQVAAFALAGLTLAFTALRGAVLTTYGAITSPVLLFAALVVGSFATLTAFIISVAGKWDQTFDWIGETWTGLKDTARSTVDGIRDAIIAGNLGLAWEVAMAGIELAAVQGWEGIKGVFRTALVGLAQMMVKAGTSLSILWGEIHFNLKKVTWNLLTWATKKSSEFTQGNEKAIHNFSMRRSLQEVFNDLKSGKITREEAVVKLNVLAAEQKKFEGRMAQIDKGREAMDQITREELGKSLDELDANNLKTLEKMREELKSLEEELAASDGDAKAKVEDARKRLEAAIAEAAAARSAADAERQKHKEDLSALAGTTGDEVNLAAKSTSAGTFSALATQYMGHAPEMDKKKVALLERMAEISKQSREHLRKLAEDGGWVATE